jgi:hypothetical protein
MGAAGGGCFRSDMPETRISVFFNLGFSTFSPRWLRV